MSTKQYIGGFTQLADGVQALGKVLTLDATDALTWATPSKGGYLTITKVGLGEDLHVTLTDIPGPVTYDWSFVDAKPGLIFTSAANLQTTTFNMNLTTTQYQPFVMDITDTIYTKVRRYSALVKVRIIDVNGFVYFDYYNHSITMYTSV